MKSLLMLISCLFLLLSTLQAQIIPNDQIMAAYDRGTTDAAIAEKGENYGKLIAIKPQNRRLVWNKDKTKLLVVSWKSSASYERFIKPETQTSMSEAYVMWVSTAPQVKKFCRNFMKNNPTATKSQLDMRLKQYLGLYPTWNYDVFVEMWVSPDDLFRPCVDPEINDRQCNMQFGKTIPTVKNIKNYKEFYQNLYFQDYRNSLRVPWTGLGYTYDWGSLLTEVGASEFIMVPGTTYEIKQAVPTEEYCKAGN